MSKERRLGRGLEALLGRIPKRPEGGSATPEEADRVKPAIGPEHRGSALGPHERAARLAALSQPVPGEPHPTIAALAAAERAKAEAAAQGQGVDQVSDQDPDQEDVVEISTADDARTGVRPSARAPETGVVQVDVHLIESNPYQPRKDFDAEGMESLAASIGDHGLLQPLVVRRKDEAYQLIAGERRLRAAQRAGWNEVPVKVVEADDREAAELAIVENLQRRDLNALEKAACFQRYIETNGCTQDELAARLKVDRSTIANLIRLLELPEPVKEAVRTKALTAGHARALLPLGDEREQNDFCARIQQEGWTVRQTERFVQEAIEKADAEPLVVLGMDGKARTPRPKDDQIAALEQEFRSALGVKVKLTHNARGRGKLVIQFANHDEFERLRQHVLHDGKKRTEGVG